MLAKDKQRVSSQSEIKKASGMISRVSREDISPGKNASNKAVSIKFPESGPIEFDQQPVLGQTSRLKPGMSNAVKAANDDLYEAEKQMKDLEKKRIERMKDLETFDCAEMLKTAGVKIKVMN